MRLAVRPDVPSSRRCWYVAATLACALVVSDARMADAKPRLLVRQPTAGISQAHDVSARVRQRLAAHGFVVGTRPAWVVAPAITKLSTSGTTIACAVEIRVAPLDAHGRERWDAGRTVIATGSARVTNARRLRRHEVARSANECLDTAIAETVARRVAPFLARVMRPSA